MTRIMNRMDAGLVEWAFLQENKQCQWRYSQSWLWRWRNNCRFNKTPPVPDRCGIDYSEDAVKLAIRKNRVLVKAGSVKIQQADVERLPFQNEKFNILAIRTHYFWEHLEAAFTELFRVLKPQGELLVFSGNVQIQYHMDES